MPVTPNSEAYENEILIEPTGFREYDARWRFPEQINLRGMQALGLSIGTMLHDSGQRPDIVVGHDYRSYSAYIKQALIIGLMTAGCRVHDIGLALSPVAYFAQFDLDCPAVAMVTASHNENGWTGVKMGINRPLTFGPGEMSQLKEMALHKTYKSREGGRYIHIENMRSRYLVDLAKGGPLKRKLKVVAACGNGTAGIYAPVALEMIGCEAVPMDCKLDYNFPRHNPNPEDMAMLHALRDKVLDCDADIGFAFDGDGDRCGIVDNSGEEIFADKMGVLLARDLAAQHGGGRFVADVKSTSLYKSDAILARNGGKTDYWITGHSYIKRRVNELNALAGFEKSGHFFFNGPIGRGYDDGVLSAIMICRMMDRHEGMTLADVRKTLRRTWSSPSMSPDCPDEAKYAVVDRVIGHYREKMKNGEKIMNRKISEIMTVNGARIVLEDGTWGLVRASSNKPSLVVVVESPVSETGMKGMFRELDNTLSSFKEIGAYDQKIDLAA